jgi:hypothetical protein
MIRISGCGSNGGKIPGDSLLGNGVVPLRSTRGSDILRRRKTEEDEMAIPMASLPPGTRVKVRRGTLPQDPAVLGRAGSVVVATEYRDEALGVVLDGESALRYFTPGELEVVTAVPLPPERESAKRLRALP